MSASTNFSAGTVVTSTWLNAIDEATFEHVVNVKLHGAVGDGVTDDTAAIQAAIDSMVNVGPGAKLFFPRVATTSSDDFDKGVYRITSSLTFPAAWVRNQIDFGGCEIRYDGPVDSTAAIFKITKNLFYENVFMNGKLDANDRAGYCLYVVGEANLYALKANTLHNMSLENPTVMNVMLGNQTVNSFDTDAADWLFSKVYFRHITPAIGMQVDGDNILNTSFHHTWWNANSGTYSGGHCRFLRGSGYYMFDTFFGYLGPTSNYCIYLRDGQLGVFGCNTEEGSILQTETMSGERKSIALFNIGVNEGTTSSTPEYAVYAPVGQIEMRSCTFGKANLYPRKVYAGDSLHCSNVYLGSNASGSVWGTYEVDYPDRCSVEGQYLNNVKVLNANPTLNLWKGTGVGAYPFGYNSSGFGTFTVEQSTNNNVQGPYTALITVTSGYATGNDIDGLQCQIPVATTTKTGSRTYMAVLRGGVAASSTGTIKARLNVYNASGSYLNGNNITITPDIDGFYTEIFHVIANDESSAYITLTVGSGTAAATASIYVDNMYIVQVEPFTVNGGYHYKSYVDIWTKHVKSYEGMLEYTKAGVLASGTPGSFNQMYWASAAPTVGTFRRGDVVWNTGVSAAGSPGWVCTTAGSPGTWKAMANVAA